MNLNKYKINRLETDELKPEETLADSLSIHSTMESPIGQGVFAAFYAGVALAIAFLFFKSFQLQIIDGRNYASSADQSNSSGYWLNPLRGLIYDTNGQPMVENIPAFNLIAIHRYLPSSANDLGVIAYKLANILQVSNNDLLKLFDKNKAQASFVIEKKLSKEEAIKINAAEIPGIYVVVDAQRYYIGGPATAHLIGYTAQVGPSDLGANPYYLINDRIGRLGLEAQYEQELRGQHRSVNFANPSDAVESAKPGDNLFLNIDFSIQKKLYESLSLVFASAGVRRGAAIVQNPKTGAVLGLVSMPSFDSNIFESSSLQENFVRVGNVLNSSDKPLLDRVISGRYSPGSTIKPLLALAGLKEGIVSAATLILANGSISVRSEVDPNVFYTFRDWKVHGWTDIKKAIADSVDVYFYSLGGGYGNIKGLGIDKIASYVKGAGADKITGIDLPGEIRGLVPSKEWKKETKGEAWYIGDTYNVSIGQGDLGVTPAWLNAYIGAIANGGKIMKPYVVREIKSSDGELIRQFNPQVIGEMPFDKNTTAVVREGMRQTVLSGTATIFQDIPVALAAKTGTAQITGRGLNSLFVIFGPYDDPEIVMTVLVENINQSQGLAVRVAHDFLSWYFKMAKTAEVRGSGN